MAEETVKKTYEELMKMTRGNLVKFAESVENFTFKREATRDEIAIGLLSFWGEKVPKKGKADFIVISTIKEDGVKFSPGGEYTGKRASKFLEDGQIRRKEF